MTVFELKMKLATDVCLSRCRAGICRDNEECFAPWPDGLSLRAAFKQVEAIVAVITTEEAEGRKH